MYDSLGARGIRAPLARRDQLLDANGNNGSFNSLTTDKLIVMLDPYHNHIDQAWFEVNPAGGARRSVQRRSVVGSDLAGGDARRFARVDGRDAHSVFAAPLLARHRADVGNADLALHRIGSTSRTCGRSGERAKRAAPASSGPRTASHRAASRASSSCCRTSCRASSTSSPRRAIPITAAVTAACSAGVDLKYLLTSNLTLDATINPDFGQVEVDPATINLSAFETFYEEKRPFFVAGSSAFDFGDLSCNFCSNTLEPRPVLLAPHRAPAAARIRTWATSPPSRIRRTTRRSSARRRSPAGPNGGYTVGLLDALTGRETAHISRRAEAPSRRSRSSRSRTTSSAG